MRWEKKKIKELAEVVGGGTPSTGNPLYWDGEVAWITPKDLAKRESREILRGERNITAEGLKNSSAKLLPCNTVLLSTRAPIGYVAIAKQPVSTNQGFKSLICKENVVLPEFLFYLLKNNRSLLESYSSGATFKELSKSNLLEIDVFIPPLPIQKKIASILSAYDDLIENNLKRIALLEKSARLLYEEWFVRLRFPGYEHTKITDGVPEGWERKKAFDVMNVLSGGTPKTSINAYYDGNIPFYTPKDSTNTFYVIETIKCLTEEGLKNCNSKLYPKDTIFITARGTVGKLNLAQRPMAMNQSCYALVGKAPVGQKFLYCSIEAGLDYLKKQAVGAVFDAIVVDTFKLIPFLVPTEKIIKDFEAYVEAYFNQAENLMLQNQKLKQARDILLPKLMSGEIAV